MAKSGGEIEAGVPRVGLLAKVRRRLGVITGVRDYDAEGRQHLVRLDYLDEFRPHHEELMWELEPARSVLNPGELPSFSSPAMAAEDFAAMLRAARWAAPRSYLDPDTTGPVERLPVSAPFHGAVEIDDYQLVPLLKALRMPRVGLLLADDVGLGKTIQAGLILSELLIRRRINRVLVLTPAAMRLQWRDELWSKFSLPFDVVDRESTLKLRRRIGVDANPWRVHARVIASYHYLRQPDVLEDFRSACRRPEDSAQLPWDLLIVDEVHNLMPSPFGEDSQLCQALGQIAPLFEHRLFLTATPHNGHTLSFTGLLEMLDPVRFARTSELLPAEKERIRQVVIRRLKRDINAVSDPPKFCERRPPEALLLHFGPAELALISAVAELRDEVRSRIATATQQRRLAGRFAIEILGKRLLSGPMTFLESWRRCKLGLAEDDADDQELVVAGREAAEETADDREAEQRSVVAAGVIGSWLRPLLPGLEPTIAAVDAAARRLGVDLDRPIAPQDPSADARFEKLCELLDTKLRHAGQWRQDERLVVFTEYKTTLDYLLRRLRSRFPRQEDRFLTLFGGMDDPAREQVKDAFNDAADPVRVLLATDAASEGLNLQSTARYLLHYDCPWNPSRLEQRNGRLDRHGQARDVFVHHFASDQDADLRFIEYLIGKVHQIREDLGATGELFDEATHRRLILGHDFEAIRADLEHGLDQACQRAQLPDRDADQGGADLPAQITALARELDLDPEAGYQVLATAMATSAAGRPQLTAPDDQGRFELRDASLPGWKEIIDECVRRRVGKGLGPVPKLSFSPAPFRQQVGARTVFRPRPDVQMLHLSHPLVQRATGSLARRRYPGPGALSRWTVREDQLPPDCDALIVLHAEELGVNELRETFHHWVRSYRLPVHAGELGDALPHLPAADLRGASPCYDEARRQQARELLLDLEPDLKHFVDGRRAALTDELRAQLAQDLTVARREADERYSSRQGELSKLMAGNTLQRLERELASYRRQLLQPELFGDFGARLERTIAEKQDELERRKAHLDEIRGQLARERERILHRLLPRRYAMLGAAQVFPLAVEIRLPGGIR